MTNVSLMCCDSPQLLLTILSRMYIGAIKNLVFLFIGGFFVFFYVTISLSSFIPLYRFSIIFHNNSFSLLLFSSIAYFWRCDSLSKRFLEQPPERSSVSLKAKSLLEEFFFPCIFIIVTFYIYIYIYIYIFFKFLLGFLFLASF